ncbi:MULTISPECIES: acyltransferase family protein [Kitasatospora]|uniref:Acyltransferase n=1 Tax=Kitasatospora cathayae TaxID=3004092 RepID=A0ABY7Q8T9_9ACTN|nr:acyltransferase [Kitasatospora sp. HUAS 3-15]WBP89143.1 acyltransferase [Kitasatospora sp. HUAS 3-15]
MASNVSLPPAASRLPSLAGMRFICAIAVFSAHAYVSLSFNGDWTGTNTTVLMIVGRSALSFFFVLSGFVMAWSARPGDTARAFWRRRAARIYPTHVLTWVAAVVLMLTVTGGTVTLGNAVSNLLLVHTWQASFMANNSLNVVSWSLSCEAFFYFCFPLLHRYLKRVPAKQLLWWLGGTVLAVIAVPLVTSTVFASQPKFPPFDVTYDQYWFVYLFPITRLLEFVLGILLARGVLTGRFLKVRFSHAVLAFAVAYPLAMQVPYLYSITAMSIVPVLMAVLAGAGADIRGSLSVARNPVMVWLGDVTFAFYLVHFMVLEYMYRLINDGHPASRAERVGSAALLFVVSFVIAAAVHTFFEDPLSRRWGSRRLRAEQVSPAAPQRADGEPVAR